MNGLRAYYEQVKPHLHRRNIEMAAVGLMVLCGLFVLLGSIPRQANLTYQDGAIRYQGQIVRHKMSGKGSLSFSNGDSYEGQFSNGSFSGQGVFRAKAGWVYEGEFESGLPDGQGKLTTETGVVYQGQFKKGVYQDAH